MKTEKEKMIAGEYYLAGDPILVKERRKAKNLLHRLNVTEYRMTKKAKEILAELIPNAGKSFYIEPPFHCDYGYNIICGDNVYFNVNCVVLDCAPVNIGSNVFIAPNVQIYTASHPLDAELRKSLEKTFKSTSARSNVLNWMLVWWERTLPSRLRIVFHTSVQLKTPSKVP